MRRVLYQISMPKTPGAQPTVVATAETIIEARRLARGMAKNRRDLTWEDCRIERFDNGTLVEYAGPLR